jgi:dihydroceramidase
MSFSTLGLNLKPAGLPGFWGNVTSTLDWCEENYVVSFYVAEWWNAFTNLVNHALTLLAMWSYWRCGAELRSYFAVVGLAIVGTGSLLFHGSLLFTMQMMDELPMIYAMCLWAYSVALISPSTNRYKIHAAISMSLYSIVVTTVYLVDKNPIFHEVSFGLLLLATALYLIPTLISHSSKHPELSQTLKTLYITAFLSYVFSFALWNIDTLSCDSLRDLRLKIGYPFRILTELHAWWHVGTAYGSYLFCTVTAYMRFLSLGRLDTKIKWYLLVIPVIRTHLPLDQVIKLKLMAEKNAYDASPGESEPLISGALLPSNTSDINSQRTTQQ